jgi:hypothetical protein
MLLEEVVVKPNPYESGIFRKVFFFAIKVAKTCIKY